MIFAYKIKIKLIVRVKVKVKVDSIEDDPIIFFKKVTIYRIEFEAEADFDGGLPLITVKRKMKEFEKLWEIMERIYPSQLIPPLPDSTGNYNRR